MKSLQHNTVILPIKCVFTYSDIFRSTRQQQHSNYRLSVAFLEFWQPARFFNELALNLNTSRCQYFIWMVESLIYYNYRLYAVGIYVYVDATAAESYRYYRRKWSLKIEIYERGWYPFNCGLCIIESSFDNIILAAWWCASFFLASSI